MWCASDRSKDLTPELSRADLRRRQSHNLSGSLPTPRSGVGLDELLAGLAAEEPRLLALLQVT